MQQNSQSIAYLGSDCCSYEDKKMSAEKIACLVVPWSESYSAQHAGCLYQYANALQGGYAHLLSPAAPLDAPIGVRTQRDYKNGSSICKSASHILLRWQDVHFFRHHLTTEVKGEAYWTYYPLSTSCAACTLPFFFQNFVCVSGSCQNLYHQNYLQPTR